MAIFHLNAKVISRGKGQSAIAAAAYRSGERLRDEQANEQKHYTSRAERIQFTDIMAPKDAPEWAHDRNQLWNHAERAEKRKDGQLAREIEVSLPHELTEQQREWLVKDFAREAFVRKGYAVDIAIHAPDKEADERNHHAHLMVTMRTLGPEGFAAKKDRSLNSGEQLGQWREQWAHLANRHLERHGHEARIDHRSLKEQGIDREATVHLGYAAVEIASRGGQSDRMDELRGILDRNEIRADMAAIEQELRALEAAEAEAERKRQAEQAATAAPPAEPPRSQAAEANARAGEPPPVQSGRSRATNRRRFRPMRRRRRNRRGVTRRAITAKSRAGDRRRISRSRQRLRRRARRRCGDWQRPTVPTGRRLQTRRNRRSARGRARPPRKQGRKRATSGARRRSGRGKRRGTSASLIAIPTR